MRRSTQVLGMMAGVMAAVGGAQSASAHATLAVDPAATERNYSPAGPSITVALNWAEVSQTTLDRCGLTGLENLLLQSLVEQGYAVVAETRPHDVTLVLSDAEYGLSVEVDGFGVVEQHRVALPKSCDSTVVVDILLWAKLTLAAVRAHQPNAARGPLADTTVVAEGEQAAKVEPVLAASYPWTLRVGLGAVTGGTHGTLPTIRVVGQRNLGTRLALGAAFDFGAIRARDLWILEPHLGAEAAYAWTPVGSFAVVIGIEADLMAHVYRYQHEPAGMLMSGRVGLPIQLSLPGWRMGLELLPYLRLTPVLHRVLGHVAYQADRFGGEVSFFFVPIGAE